MAAASGFHTARHAVIAALLNGAYRHEARKDIATKNLLLDGRVSPSELVAALKRCSGHDHSSSPHHQISSITVHVIRTRPWYVKFYLVDPVTWFISVHE